MALILNSTIAEKNVSIATEYFRIFYGLTAKDRTYSGGTNGFIPFKISLNMDGISGLKIYQTLRINSSFLPQGYADTIDFIITGVNHKLKDNDWETDINCAMVPKFEEYTEILTTDNFTYVAYTPPVIVQPVVITSNNNYNYGGLRGDLFSWVPGPNYPDPSDPNNYNGTKYPYSTYPDFTETQRQNLLEFQKDGYIIAILKSSESTIQSRPENWIKKPTTNPPTIKENKPPSAVIYNTIDFTQEEQTNMYKDILSRIGAQPTKYNILWMKVWRAAEGASATYNPWNSTQKKPNSTKYNNKPGVQNYWTYSDGLDATVTTLTNGFYPTILRALIKGLNSYDEMKELASLVQLWDMTDKIPDKWK